MAKKTKSELKSLFETGDVLTESSFNDLIDTVQNSPIDLGVSNPRTEGVASDVDSLGRGLDGSLWIKTGNNDSDWEQLFLSEDGVFVGDYQFPQLAHNEVAPPNSLALYGGVPSFGDGATAKGQSLLARSSELFWPDEVIDFSILSSDGGFTLISDPGAGGFAVSGGATGISYSVNNGTTSFISFADKGGGEYALNSDETITVPQGSPCVLRMWPATSATSGVVGAFFRMVFGEESSYVYRIKGIVNDVTYVDLGYGNFSDLDLFKINSNVVEYFYVGSNSKLQRLVLPEFSTNANIDVWGLSSLKQLYAPKGIPSFQYMDFYQSNVTTDVLYEFLANMPANSCPNTLDLSTCPCSAVSGSGQYLTDGAFYVESDIWNAEGTGVSNIVGASLTVENGTLNSDGTIS